MIARLFWKVALAFAVEGGPEIGFINDLSDVPERRRLRTFMSGKTTEKVLKIEALDVDQLLLDPENPRLEGMGPLKD